MVKRIGIEFEMICLFNSHINIFQLKERMKKYGSIKRDGSIHILNTDSEIINKYAFSEELEFITNKILFNTEEEIKTKVIEMLKDIFKEEEISINEFQNKKMAILFNKSTGLHIHYSNSKNEIKIRNAYLMNKRIVRRETNELKLFFDIGLLNRMIKEINKNVVYESVKKDFSRSYTNESGLLTRYKQINVSNSRNHGSIEFRLFNLHDIKTNEFQNCLLNQLESLFKSIEIGYKYIEDYNKTIERRIKKELSKPEESIFKKEMIIKI